MFEKKLTFTIEKINLHNRSSNYMCHVAHHPISETDKFNLIQRFGEEISQLNPLGSIQIQYRFPLSAVEEIAT